MKEVGATYRRILLDARVAEISDERSFGDGIWVYTKPGFCDHSSMGPSHDAGCCRHSIHEDTWSLIVRQMNNLKPCDCARCKEPNHDC